MKRVLKKENNTPLPTIQILCVFKGMVYLLVDLEAFKNSNDSFP